MLFLRKHTYLILGLLVGIVIGGVILLQRGQQTSASNEIASDNADQTIDTAKTQTRRAELDTHPHDSNLHDTSSPSGHRLPEANTPTAKLKQTQRGINTSTLRKWKHHPHTSDHRTSPTLAEIGLPQEKLDRILQEANMSIIPEGGIDDPVAWAEEMFQKRVNIVTEDMDTVSAFKLLKVLPGRHYKKYTREFAQRAIDENPDFLEGRLYLVYKGPDDARAAEEYRNILRDFPDSRGALAGLGSRLVMDHPVEAIYHLKRANNMNPSSGLAALGRAYQRLGDYKTAWTYLKKAQTYPHGPLLDRDVEAIEAGKPLIQPIPLKGVKFPASTDSTPEVSDAIPQGTNTVPDIVRDDTRWFKESEETSPEFSHERETTDTERARAAVAAKQAHEDYLKYKECAQKEINDFIQWAETIMNADAPMDTNNFLMKEMEAFLKGGKPQFEPVRIVRAFEIFERYGPKEGIKRLQKSDPKVAEQVQRLLEEKRPHNPNNKGDNK